MDDTQLIHRFQNGDAESFNRLVLRWQHRIHRFAFRFFADPDEASEITQKTFIRAYHKLHALSDIEKFSAWIYRIANNLCIDETRRAGRQKSTVLDSWIESTDIASSITPSSILERSELGVLMQKALLVIPDEQRVVIILKEYEGLTFREIAEILDEPLNTVKSRMYYGLKALRKVFEKWNIEKEALYYDD